MFAKVMFPKSKPVPTGVIVFRWAKLPDEDITAEILALTERQYQALMDLIDQSRQEFAAHAAISAETNNPLAMSKDNGAYEALSGLIIELNDRRADQTSAQ